MKNFRKSGFKVFFILIILLNVSCESKMDKLISNLNDPDEYVRSSAAMELGEIGNIKAVKPLSVLLYEDEPRVKADVAEALGKIGDVKAVEPLIDALKCTNFFVRIKSVEALGKIGDKRAVAPLIEILLEDSEFLNSKDQSMVHEKTAEALGKIGDHRAVLPLVDLLENEHLHYRDAIIIALGAIGDNRSLPSLINILKNGVPTERIYAAKALGNIGDKRAIDHLVFALNDDLKSVRKNAAISLKTLNWIPSTKYQKTVYYIENQLWDECFKMSADAVDPLIRALNDENENVRNKISETLIKIGVPAIDPLITALESNQDWVVREKAAEVLGNIGGSRAIPYLVDALSDWKVGGTAAAALNKLSWNPISVEDKIHLFVAERNLDQLDRNWVDTRRVLYDDLKSDNNIVIRNAVFALISIGKQEVVPDLIDFIKNNGTKITAEAYLNCGNQQLSSAAKTWLENNNYVIIPSSSSGDEIIWGIR